MTFFPPIMAYLLEGINIFYRIVSNIHMHCDVTSLTRETMLYAILVPEVYATVSQNES